MPGGGDVVVHRQLDGAWTVCQGEAVVSLGDGEMRCLAELVGAAPLPADDDEIAVAGRLVCRVCDRVGNVHPDLHVQLFGHQPVVLTEGALYAHLGGGGWQFAEPGSWVIEGER